MKKLLITLFFLTVVNQVKSQHYSQEDNNKRLHEMEDQLKGYSDSMINAQHWYLRFVADSFFTRGFVKALKVNNSFHYPFDSLKTISKLYAPDSSFRIFTWQMMKDYTFYRQRGAIQMRTSDGSLKLYPLFDASSFTKAPNDSIRDIKNWIGAIYYKILLNMDGDKKVYTLLGYDENGPRSNKKWMDILTFDKEGIPHFGGYYFKMDTLPKTNNANFARFNVEYKKEAKMRVQYDKESDMIIYDHLISESDEPEYLYTYIPDGSYEAFKWENNHWQHISKLKTLFLGNGNAPMDNAILDDDGNINQKKLEEMVKKSRDTMAQEIKNEEDEKRANGKKTSNNW